MVKTVLVTGGAGYTGSVLVLALLAKGYRVKVVDLLIYGGDTLPPHPLLEIYQMDIRDPSIAPLLENVDVVFHLAGVSNDPGEGLEPEVGYQINLHAVEPLVRMCKERGVKKFIYPSSCSVYGQATEEVVTEESAIQPLTAYAECKAKCEEIILSHQSESFCCTILRPATVCGVSPRQRFDLLANGFVNEAYFKRVIHVRGAERVRPGVHILDLVDLYVKLIEIPAHKINGQVFNVAFENKKVVDIAHAIAAVVGDDVQVRIQTGNDRRSYNVDSGKLQRELGFLPRRNTADAVHDLLFAMGRGKFADTFTSTKYHNKYRQPLYLSRY